jgi:acyl carrier protein
MQSGRWCLREDADDHAAAADDHADVDVVALPTAAHAEPSPVLTAAAAEDRPAGWSLDEEHVGHLMLFYFRGADAVLAWARDEDPRRARVLEVLADRIEEVTDYPAAVVTEVLRFREDLGVDSLDAVEISTAMEDEFHLRVSAAQLASLDTVGDAIDLILGHADAAASAEFDATMAPPADGPAPSAASFPVAPTTSAVPTRKEQAAVNTVSH